MEKKTHTKKGEGTDGALTRRVYFGLADLRVFQKLVRELNVPLKVSSTEHSESSCSLWAL